MGSESTENQKKTAKSVSIQWGDSAPLPTTYANQLSIFGTRNEVYLVFGELSLPPLRSSSEEPPKKLDIRPVAKIVVTPEAMRRMAEVMSKNLQRRDQKEEDRDGD